MTSPFEISEPPPPKPLQPTSARRRLSELDEDDDALPNRPPLKSGQKEQRGIREPPKTFLKSLCQMRASPKSEGASLLLSAVRGCTLIS